MPLVRVSNGGSEYETVQVLANGTSNNFSATLQYDGVIILTTNSTTGGLSVKINNVAVSTTYSYHSWGSATVVTYSYLVKKGDTIRMSTTNSGWTLCVLYRHE
jgi:hypothetical protein